MPAARPRTSRVLTTARDAVTAGVALALVAGLMSVLVTVLAPAGAAAADRRGPGQARQHDPAATPSTSAGKRRTGPGARHRGTVGRVKRPVLGRHGFADPSVLPFRHGYVGVATGPSVPRSVAERPAGPWRRAGSALSRMPRWATSNRVWASDLEKVRGRWLLYFSAEVAGLGPGGRCIGVAVARRPTGSFRPQGGRPLVCPRAARTRRAVDTLDSRRGWGPRAGVIDAEGFHRGPRRYLVYRTQGTPATIRLVRLPRSGAVAGYGARSRVLVRTRGVTENPVLLERGRRFYLLTSEGYFGDCGYRTTWRSSRSLWDFSRAQRRVLLHRGGTGLCGPGGADVVDRGRGRALVYLHAWTCRSTRRACPAGHDYDVRQRWGARRSLYAAYLRWPEGRPRVTRFLRPRAWAPRV